MKAENPSPFLTTTIHCIVGGLIAGLLAVCVLIPLVLLLANPAMADTPDSNTASLICSMADDPVNVKEPRSAFSPLPGHWIYRMVIQFVLTSLPLSGVWQAGLRVSRHAKALLAHSLPEAAWVLVLQGSKEVTHGPWRYLASLAVLPCPSWRHRIVLAGAIRLIMPRPGTFLDLTG